MKCLLFCKFTFWVLMNDIGDIELELNCYGDIMSLILGILFY